jgi:hypothetical protein
MAQTRRDLPSGSCTSSTHSLIGSRDQAASAAADDDNDDNGDNERCDDRSALLTRDRDKAERTNARSANNKYDDLDDPAVDDRIPP